MSRAEIKYDDYKVKAFLDANIILEGRPVAELPWEDIHGQGPIIALITPTTIKEVDSKKQDGRIGKRARDFNRLLASVASGGPPIVIRESNPRVELALSRARRIPWNQHDDLDPDDGDSCFVADALHAKDMSAAGKILVSHDIKPIALASNYDLQTCHVSNNWLRPTEPSPHDKEMQRLKGKIADYEAKEPAFEITVKMIDAEPVKIVRIEDLTDAERRLIEGKIVADHPKVSQSSGPFAISSLNFDDSYSGRYEKYRERVLTFMENYSERFERLFNQARVAIRVENTGKLQAENVVIEVNVSTGWVHDRFVWVSPSGPTAPKPRTHAMLNISRLQSIDIPTRVGRHEFDFKDSPRWASSFSVTCEDFRHEEHWDYNAVVGVDARAQETKIVVSVTAANFRGKARAEKVVERNVETLHISKLIELDSFEITRATPIDGIIQRDNYEDIIDWKAFSLDAED